MPKNVYEYIEEYEAAPDKKEYLKTTPNYFREALKLAYDNTEFYSESFPEDYKTPDTLPGIRYAGLENELRRIYLFIKGNPVADSLTPEKRHILLLQMMESFEPKEAKVLINILNKSLNLTDFQLDYL